MAKVSPVSGPFVSLHNHTELGSPLDGMNDTYDLFVRAKEVDHPAVAVTDHGTMAAIYDAWKASKETGVKLIPGMEAYFTDDLKEGKNYHMVLLAQNEKGYRNLLRLNYESYKNQVFGYMGKKTPRISWEHIEQFNEGIVALTACSNGLIGKTLITNQDEDKAVEYIKRLNGIFNDRFFLELQPHGLCNIDRKGREVNQPKLNQCLLRLSHDMNIPFVITCDAHYRDKEHAKYHDFMLAIKDKKAADDPDRFRYGVQDMYLKTYEEVIDHFGQRIAEIGMANSIKIMESCDNPNYIEPKGPILPRFPVKDEPEYERFKEWHSKNSTDIPEDKAYMRYKCIEGFKKISVHFSRDEKKEYWNRVKKELDILESRDFSSYMLIVADFVNWAKKQGIPVGPARGSAAGALISYLLGITEIDPMEYDLIFERFHNAMKKSFPDIDIDFAQGTPDLVKNYLKDKYGHDKVASISNLSSMSPKVCIKDAARSLRLGGDKSTAFKIANHITSIMPDEKTIEDAMKKSKNFAGYMKKYPELYEYASKLQGLTRNWSVHAAGVVISDRPLYEVAPLRIDAEDLNDPDTWLLATQWEKNRCEENGLIKIDCLGLKTLNVIDDALRSIEDRTGEKWTYQKFTKDPDAKHIPLDDEDTYKMLAKGITSGVFQLESSMTPYVMRLKPKNIEAISDINALGRPSCLPEVRQEYIDRTLGIEKVSFDHPKLKRALEKTNGVMLYEESAMFVAEDVAGWDLNQADSLRKLSKLKGKNPELAEQTEINFLKDSVENGGLSYQEARLVWEKFIKPLSGYSFNKSHSVSYSHISYWTAWLKCHYKTDFMCALLNSENQNSDSVLEYLNECRKLDIKILPPDIQKSGGNYTVVSENEIATGLSAVKGVGDKAVMEIIQHKYNSLADFFAYTEGRVVNKTVIQSLAKAGAFDCFNVRRKDIHDNYSKYRTKVNNSINKVKDKMFKEHLSLNPDLQEHYSSLSAKEKRDMKSEFRDTCEVDIPKIISEIEFKHSEEEWDRKDVLLNEMKVLGRTVSGQIHEIFKGFFRKDNPIITKLDRVPNLDVGQKVKIEVIIKSLLKEFTIKNGKNVGRKFGKYLIEDVFSNQGELTVWADDYSIYKNILHEGAPVRAICQVNEYMGQKSLSLKALENVSGKIIM